MKLALDFEYKNSRNSYPTLVSYALSIAGQSKSAWLYEKIEAQAKLKSFLLKLRDSVTILSFNVEAEARSLIALGLNPLKFQWVDLQIEWKMLTNHLDRYMYGKHFIDGRFKTTYRKAYGDSFDKRPHDRPSSSLLSATFKLLGLGSEQDYKHKEYMRHKILHSETYSPELIKEILAYGGKDVKELEEMYDTILKIYKLHLPKKLLATLEADMLFRGETVARTAIITAVGYPVDLKAVKNFAANVPHIMKDMQEDINSQFPGVFKAKPGGYSLNTKMVKDWIRSSPYEKKWERTKGKDLSLKKDAFEEFFSFRHDFPRDNFPAQILRFLKLKESLNGFAPKSVKAKNQSNFFDYVGDDGRVHPYLNPYGSMTSRYQPKATGFIFLKAAWMRSLVVPAPGKVIVGIDYSSQEFLLSALLSKDLKMLDAYRSGDVYLYFAKLAKAVPMSGTKEQYSKERDLFKATVLGLSYGMKSKSLAAKLTMDTGRPVDEIEAQELSDKFYKVFSRYANWRDEILEEYELSGSLHLPDGWTLFGDNDNPLSVGNFPVQGMGAAILKRAIAFCQDAGLKVIVPLHDAIYFEADQDKYLEVADIACQAMALAFASYFKGDMRKEALWLIRMDINAWGPGLSEGSIKTPVGRKVTTQKIYIDKRSKAEYDRFSKYFKQGEKNVKVKSKVK